MGQITVGKLNGRRTGVAILTGAAFGLGIAVGVGVSWARNVCSGYPPTLCATTLAWVTNTSRLEATIRA